MSNFSDAFAAAFSLILNFDGSLAEIVVLSLQVSFAAVLAASFIGLPLGAALAVFRFPGRTTIVVLLNALMGLPPVVVGLIVYLVLSRAGPLGTLGLLFTPMAMIIAQTILITPIIAALTAPTSALARPKPASIVVTRLNLLSHKRVLTVSNGPVPKDLNCSDDPHYTYHRSPYETINSNTLDRIL